MLSVGGRVSPDLLLIDVPSFRHERHIFFHHLSQSRPYPVHSPFLQPDIEGFLTLSTFSGLVCAGGGILGDLFGDQVADKSLERLLTRVLSFVVMQPACVDIQ